MQSLVFMEWVIVGFIGVLAVLLLASIVGDLSTFGVTWE
jgi:hypothetical protein